MTVKTQQLIGGDDRALAEQVDALRDRARDYFAAASSENTQRAYRADWRHFATWCAAHHQTALPATPAILVLYLTDLAEHGYKPATIQHRLVAISQAHKEEDHPDPTKDPAVRKTHTGIRRTLGTAQRGKAPAITAELRRMVRALDLATARGLRDRALLLVGFAGAFRRSELVALDVADVRQTDEGLEVTLRRSKTDQEGKGRTIGLPYGSDHTTCPVRALAAWRAAGGITDGALFRTINARGHVTEGRLSDRAVARAVKRAARAAGLEPKDYAGHSLRAGLATSAAQAGVAERIIAKQTGHKSMTVLRRYIRDSEIWTENAAAKVGL